MLEGAPALGGADQLDAPELREHPGVVADVPQRLAELGRELLGARHALVERYEDAVSDRVRERADDPRIELFAATRNGLCSFLRGWHRTIGILAREGRRR